MNGKSRCKILKEIRRQIADQNDIVYVTSECQYQGECSGTCPKCEAEVRYLEQELAKRQRLGRAVAIAGLAATLTASAAGCGTNSYGLQHPTSNSQTTAAVTTASTTDTQTAVTTLPATESVAVETPTAGVPALEVTDLAGDVTLAPMLVDLKQFVSNGSHDALIIGMRRDEIRDAWGENLDGSDLYSDTFLVDVDGTTYQVSVAYHEEYCVKSVTVEEYLETMPIAGGIPIAGYPAW